MGITYIWLKLDGSGKESKGDEEGHGGSGSDEEQRRGGSDDDG